MNKIFFILLFFFISLISSADEGMWLPLLIEKYNIEIMQEKGLKLSAEDIYSINNSSIKDAVVVFGNGCTGAVISDDGLIITNHHCGYDQIQYHSTIDHNYLVNGFWAMSKEEELPNPGLSVSFLIKIEDVTSEVLNGIDDNIEGSKRDSILKINIAYIEESSETESSYIAKVKSFFYGNEYYLFIYETFTDVRLVGAPPSSIGKFGGDTDNWMWPRHTGDFSIFRIYANDNNAPAEYNEKNIPYNPNKSLTISLKGIKENDFSWIFGYPGSTEQFLYSGAMEFMLKKSLPQKIAIRDIKLQVMKKAMEDDPAVNIKYAAKYAHTSNSWKKWIGIINGLDRMNALSNKTNYETEFIKWIYANDSRIKYQSIIPTFDSLHQEIEKYKLVKDYIKEIFHKNEILSFINENSQLINAVHVGTDTNLIEINKELIENATIFFKNYYFPIDKKISKKLINKYITDIPKDFHPKYIEDLLLKYKGNIDKMVDWMYKKSIFTDSTKFFAELNNSFTKLYKDPFYKLNNNISKLYYYNVEYSFRRINEQLYENYHLYVQGLMEMKKENIFYPDANFTMRLTYGNISGYCPKDAVCYDYYSTLNGIIEKLNENVYDYKVPDKLIQLFKNRDYGNYGMDSIMPVCFIATNHTSGGNSGSPVFNANGHLIGLNFDRCWEGTMSDYMFDPEMCRNISLDMRYVLFIIDKYAGAKYLIDEMNVIYD
ncbi:S46 family peptidase [Bacteroidota bacterium]